MAESDYLLTFVPCKCFLSPLIKVATDKKAESEEKPGPEIPAGSTLSAEVPTAGNKQPPTKSEQAEELSCNNYVEFCSRKYSNITSVGTHSAAFTTPSNPFSNQNLDVTTALNDGANLVQFQIHMKDGAPELCHNENTRAIIFLVSAADREKDPWLLSEFDFFWETPFSPTDSGFPCTVQRPASLTSDDARGRPYILNTSLNREGKIIIPDKDNIQRTNTESGDGSLGLAADKCRNDWGHYPKSFLVDFYEEGAGSVFKAAAKINNVEYKLDCCGKNRWLQLSIGCLTRFRLWGGVGV
ncbi:hypothetical protein HRG_002843 [Hirsutella rhossiliensis]|uniref:PLC-like phosphodiesterase n=1 Tax=Hirsutella rhossiliensis TaxID=111463 RepID=A0A9P8N551_9HYPO|nr:uncharacterized protein HRG_02843 [Hirsutella rhossiliensis]KAH0964827.1 hypothetical protein HRG_02843 [Hirsutella rhossiliensis]